MTRCLEKQMGSADVEASFALHLAALYHLFSEADEDFLRI